MKEYACADCESCGNWDSEMGCWVGAQSIPWDYECPDFCVDDVPDGWEEERMIAEHEHGMNMYDANGMP